MISAIGSFNASIQAIEPHEVIKPYYKKAKSRLPQQKTGNVLAYQNKANQTIILKNGQFASMNLETANADTIVIPLEDVIAITDPNIPQQKYTVSEGLHYQTYSYH